MKKLIMILLVLSFISLVSASDSVIRDGDCNAGETCLFSQYQMNDSMIGACGYYNFSVCYPETKPTTIRDGSCNAGEYSLLTMYQRNDSHVGETGYYNFSICVTGSNLTYFREDASACEAGDRGIISLYQRNDSHVGAIGYYNFTLCENDTVGVAPDITPPTWDNCRNFTHTINTSFSDSITASDDSGIDSYILNDTTYFNISIYTGLITNLTNLSRIETYNFNLSVNDTAGNYANCYFWIDVVADTFPPNITIDVPVNDTTYDTSSINLNVTINDNIAVSESWYSVDDAANQTLTPNVTMNNLGFEAYHNIIVCANDTAGNTACSGLVRIYIGKEYWKMALMIAIIGLALLFIYLGFFIFSSDYWLIKNSLFMTALILGVIAMNSARIMSSSSSNLSKMSETGFIVAIVVLLVMFLYLFILTFKNVIDALKHSRDSKNEETNF